MRTSLAELESKYEELEDAYSSQRRIWDHNIAKKDSQVLDLERQVQMLNEELLEFKNIAASRSHNIEELQIQLNELSVAQDEVAQRVVDNENWAVVRDELHRQADHLRAVESENSRMKSELSNLRKRQANAEILKEQIRELERKAHGAEQAREQVTILEAKLEAARKETEEWYI